MLADISNATERAAQETARAENWLRKAYTNIMENIDPDVIKLKKLRKVVIAPGAFDLLVGGG